MTDQELKQLIDDKIYENKKGEITATVLNELLKDIVDFANKTSFEQLNINTANIDICNATSCSGTDLTYTNGNITNLITDNIKTNKIYNRDVDYIEITDYGIKLQANNDIILQCDDYIFLNQDVKYKEGSYFYFSNDETNYIQYDNDKINIVGNVEFVNDIKLDNKLYFNDDNYIQYNDNIININGDNININATHHITLNATAEDGINIGIIRFNGNVINANPDSKFILYRNGYVIQADSGQTIFSAPYNISSNMSRITISNGEDSRVGNKIKIVSQESLTITSNGKTIELDSVKMQKLIDLLS